MFFGLATLVFRATFFLGGICPSQIGICLRSGDNKSVKKGYSPPCPNINRMPIERFTNGAVIGVSEWPGGAGWSRSRPRREGGSHLDTSSIPFMTVLPYFYRTSLAHPAPNANTKIFDRQPCQNIAALNHYSSWTACHKMMSRPRSFIEHKKAANIIAEE